MRSAVLSSIKDSSHSLPEKHVVARTRHVAGLAASFDDVVEKLDNLAIDRSDPDMGLQCAIVLPAVDRMRPTKQVPTKMTESPFKPALIVVDLQEDFCPPSGSLAVPEGRDVAPFVNKLLDYPFHIRVATKDWHPKDHISFASNHDVPDNKPFESFTTIKNPLDPDEQVTTRLWPDHCVQGTKGAELIQELDSSKIDHIVEKGQDKRVEMYSAFADPFATHVSKSGLADLLRKEAVTDCYVVGLATDYCIKYTAIDAAKEGFKTWVVKDAIRGVDRGESEKTKACFSDSGVTVISFDGPEVAAVRDHKH